MIKSNKRIHVLKYKNVLIKINYTDAKHLYGELITGKKSLNNDYVFKLFEIEAISYYKPTIT